MKIGARLITGFIAVVVLSCIVAGVGIFNIRNITEDVSRMAHVTMKADAYSREMGRYASLFNVHVKSMVTAKTDFTFKLHQDELPAIATAMDRLIKDVYELPLNDDEKRMMDEAVRARADYRALVSEIVKLREAGEIEKSQAKVTDVERLGTPYVTFFTRIQDYEVAHSQEAVEDVRSEGSTAALIMGGMTAAAVILAMIIALRLTAGITRPLNEAVQAAQSIAKGNLTVNVTSSSKDEIGQLMQAMKDMCVTLFNSVSQIRQSADTIMTAASEIASGTQDLSSRTEQQASSLEETASSMEEITSTVRQNGDNARQANQLANQASEVAVKGGEAAARVAETMTAIDASANKIENIISVIDGIAFQTNILALNAAVEAARAGEQGRGFAVVATEVRSLAQRSATAAREIKDLIDDSVAKTRTGSELVQQSSETMAEIGESIRRVNDISNEITMATQEQIQGIEQVNQAVTEMDSVSQQNAALVEQAAAASESLKEQARILVDVVNHFNLGSGMGGGVSYAAAPSAPASKPAAAPLKRPAPAAAPARQLSSPAKSSASSSSVIPSNSDDGDWEEF